MTAILLLSFMASLIVLQNGHVVDGLISMVIMIYRTGSGAGNGVIQLNYIRRISFRGG